MANRPARFTETDVRRAVKAAESAGLRVGSVKIGADGSIEVIAATPATPALDRKVEIRL